MEYTRSFVTEKFVFILVFAE